MLSGVCRRCKGTEHEPEKHLLTCQNCRKTWHHCCHIPMILDPEMRARITGSIHLHNARKRGEKADLNQLSEENWLCRRCCKNSNLGIVEPSIEKLKHQKSKSRDDVDKLVQDQSIIIISDSDMDDIQLIGVKPAAGAPMQRVDQRPDPPSVRGKVERDRTSYSQMTTSTRSVVSSRKVVHATLDHQVSLNSPTAVLRHGLVTSVPLHQALNIEDKHGTPAPLTSLPRPAPQSPMVKNKSIDIDSSPEKSMHLIVVPHQITVPMTATAAAHSSCKVTSRRHSHSFPLSAISVPLFAPALRSSSTPTLSNIVSDLRHRNIRSIPVADSEIPCDPLSLVSPRLRQWILTDQAGAEQRIRPPHAQNEKEVCSRRKKLMAERFDIEQYDPDVLIFPKRSIRL
ncbi:hypothetical protein J3R30DRAFT_2138427 [Lentinula aciculospora]|uniref:PHD-type domain-containing protein n=1 Tax=Lentinula aciculospora TaxID=153920 RepID=A0A9W9AGH6_9AGAR|nr:hypothetical protein J3R30DRAFT_2138427 [Lentinula aciculospora]